LLIITSKLYKKLTKIDFSQINCHDYNLKYNFGWSRMQSFILKKILFQSHKHQELMPVTYSNYLKIDELLNLQECQSKGPEHDEMLFILIHL